MPRFQICKKIAMMSEPRVIVKNVSENGISADFHILWYKISVITGLRHSMKKIWNLLIKVVNLTPINQKNMMKNNLEEKGPPLQILGQKKCGTF